MNVLKQMKGKQTAGGGMSSALAFILGGAAGGLYTYFFRTERGITSRKMIMEKAACFSGNTSKEDESARIKMAVHEDESEEGQAGHEHATGDEATPVSKAQNMVSHLKHSKNSNPATES